MPESPACAGIASQVMGCGPNRHGRFLDSCSKSQHGHSGDKNQTKMEYLISLIPVVMLRGPLCRPCVPFRGDTCHRHLLYPAAVRPRVRVSLLDRPDDGCDDPLAGKKTAANLYGSVPSRTPRSKRST